MPIQKRIVQQINSPIMLGVILCGGQSSRMGSDKGLLRLQTGTWTQRAAEKIQSFAIPVIISVNPAQAATYQSKLPGYKFVTDNPSLSLKGPLSGLLSVHVEYPTEDLLVLACDMPMMDTEILKELISRYQLFPDQNAFAYKIKGEPEPLCGIYRADCLSHIVSLYYSNQLAKHSMKYMLDHSRPYFIPASSAQENYFLNINTHADLNGL
jgi:molybdenum cofactor guanylyltransferase